MNQTFIGVSFKAGEKEYGFNFQYNMSETQWSKMSLTEHEILLSHIGEQIKKYKEDNHITEDTVPNSMIFTPHFPLID
jgi:hypothetical protein